MRSVLLLALPLACAAPQPPPAGVLPSTLPPPLELASVPRADPADMWRWQCCSGRYAGGLVLSRSGPQLRGIFLSDQGLGTYVDGNVDGQQVVFTRRWLNAGRLYSQIYHLQASADGQRLQGTFIETHAPGAPIEFSAERRYQPELHDFNPAPAAPSVPAPPVPGDLGKIDEQGRFLPPGCACSQPCGCSGIPSIMECHTACGCPACPPGIP